MKFNFKTLSHKWLNLHLIAFNLKLNHETGKTEFILTKVTC